MGRCYSVVWICALWLWRSCEATRIYGWGAAQPACLAETRRGRRRPPSRGSGAEPDAEKKIEKKESKAIYSKPALYDLAFGYRNYEAEIDFLIAQHQSLHEGKAPRRTLEVAAGPARHSIFALQSSQVQTATALDNSPEMVEYGKTVAMEELEVDKQASFEYIKANMENFKLSGEPCDSAWILLGSLQHLTTNSQVINCLQSINQALAPGGTLILELPHPRETFSMVECTRNGWEVPLEDEDGEQTGQLEIIWGDDNDEFDPITQVRQFSVALELKGVDDADTDLQSVREIVPLRLFTTQEIAALAQIAGFEVASLHGALANDVDVNDEDQAFRLVCVLQKV
jgi:SAM-dependent methyltransferase